mgnify:CR=1 FL=1
MQRTSRVILILILATSISYGQKVLSLTDAINIALQRNTTIQKSINTLATTKKAAETSYGQLLPSVSANGSWSWDRTESKNGGSVSVYGGNIAVRTNETRSYNAGINTSWTLYDGLANISAMNQSKNAYESAKLTLEKLKQDIVFNTISYYYDVVNNEALVKVKEEDLKTQQKNLETISERNKLGAVTLADVYKQQYVVGNAELLLVTAKNTYETSKSNLLYYLGIDVLENYTITDVDSSKLNTGINFSKDYSDIADLVAKALKNRSDYQSLKLDLQNSYESIVQAKSGHLPTLTNSMSFGLSSNDISSLFDTKRYSVGLTLGIPIFSGWSVDNKVQAAKADAMNKEVDLSDLERTIKLNIQKNYLDLQATEKQIEVCKKNVVSSDESKKIVTEKYSLGSGTLLDVISAIADYTTAQSNLVTTQYNYAKLKAQIKYLLGILDYNKFE